MCYIRCCIRCVKTQPRGLCASSMIQWATASAAQLWQDSTGLDRTRELWSEEDGSPPWIHRRPRARSQHRKHGEAWRSMEKHGEDVKVPHRPTMSIFVQWLDPQVWTWDITSGVFAHSRKLAGAPNIRSFIAFLLLCFDTATRLILTSCHVGATKLTKIWHQKIINCRSSTQFQKRISTAKQSKQGCCTKNTTLDNIMITLEPVENLGALLSVADCGIWQVPRTGQALRCETFTAAVCPPVFSSSCRYAYSVDVCWLAESPWCCSRVKNKKTRCFLCFLVIFCPCSEVLKASRCHRSKIFGKKIARKSSSLDSVCWQVRRSSPLKLQKVHFREEGTRYFTYTLV